MEMPVHVCGYTGGMNKDLSPNNYPNTCYFDAINYRVVTSDSAGLSDSSLSTIRGNAVSFTIPNGGLLCGYTILREKLIILVHAHGQTNPDRVYCIPLSKLRTATNFTITNTYYHLNTATNNLIYWEDLGFDPTHPIRVVGNYENDDIQKIYWVDGLNTLKHLNIVYNLTYNDLVNLDKELLEILPNHTYGTYTLSEEAGGHLKAGRIQYSYQLYSISGTETMFAPPSNLYNLTTYSITDGDEFVGNDIETEINKSIKVTITLSTGTSLTFDRIRLIALQYEIYGDIPTVRVVAEQALTSDTVIFTDIGNTIGELVLEEFQTIKNELIPKTIETKSGYLFAGNIEEQFFDIDETVGDLTYAPGSEKTFFDSRVYRWRYIDSGSGSGLDILTIVDDPEAMHDNPGLGSSCFEVSSITIAEDSWHIAIVIGAEEHATTAGMTFVGIQSVSGVANLRVTAHTVVEGWATTDLQLVINDISTSFLYDSGNIMLSLTGSTYDTLPSAVDVFNNVLYWYDYVFDKYAVTNLEYTYTFIDPASPNTFDCVVNKGMLGEVVIDDGTGEDFTRVLENNDCINTYNNIANDTNVTRDHEFKYKHGATDHPLITELGGTGSYISYGFISKDIIAGTVKLIGSGAEEHPVVTSLTAADAGYKDPQNVLLYMGYQRDEVYRFGIIFYDLKGRPSYTKWIGDIRFPKMCEELDPAADWDHTYELCPVDGADADGIMNIRALGIKFTINWTAVAAAYPGLLAQLSGFQIVRVARTDDDTTIKASGIIVPTHTPVVAVGYIKATSYSTYNITSAHNYQDATVTDLGAITGVNSTMNKGLVELLSPEIAVNKNIILDKTNDFLQVVGYLDNIQSEIDATSRDAYTVSAMTVTGFHSTNTLIGSSWKKTITDGFISLPETKLPTTHVIDVNSYTARGYDDEINADSPEMTFKGTSFVGEVVAPFANVDAGGADEGKAMYGYYRKPLGYSIYGGNTYAERTYNQYIKVSEFTVVPSTGVVDYSMYGGDVYIYPFAFLKLFFDLKSEYNTDVDLVHSGQVLVTFPVESKINLSYRLDKFGKYFQPDLLLADYYMAEVESIGVSQYPNDYPTDLGNLYRYNSAYSAQNISKSYLIKPFDFRGVEQQDVLVTSSERKLPGEAVDSWLIFKYNNYQNLEGECGGITRLINTNDRLIAFQPRGIATLSVLERELVESNNTTTLAVGNSGVLSRYDYLTKKAGTSIYDAIVSTDVGVYFYDDSSSCIYRIADILEAISETKGMKSYFDSRRFTAMISAYDKRNREVLFSPDSAHHTDTLAFSGFLNAFTSFYTFRASDHAYITKYITFDKFVLSSVDSAIFYLHDAGNYNQFYGVTFPSTVTVLANPKKNEVVTFHVISWLMDVLNGTTHVANETFTNVTVTDTHQSTGSLALGAIGFNSLMRRFRKWRINVFRDTVSNSGRIRDSWCKATFNYTPVTTNNKALVAPIEFYYMPTKIK
jgi:hypothetical protein